MGRIYSRNIALPKRLRSGPCYEASPTVTWPGNAFNSAVRSTIDQATSSRRFYNSLQYLLNFLSDNLFYHFGLGSALGFAHDGTLDRLGGLGLAGFEVGDGLGVGDES